MFNINSQICTTREQSERLLALGLKKETADMTIHLKRDGGWYVTTGNGYCAIRVSPMISWSMRT